MSSSHSYYVQTAAVYWSATAGLEFDLSKYDNTHDVVNAIQQIQFRGRRTNTYNALNIVRTRVFGGVRGDRRNVPDFILMFTDGIQLFSIYNLTQNLN